MQFKKAVKYGSKGRVCLMGPAGSGKTLTGLYFAHALADGGPIAVVDTEHGSASKYADDGIDFDVLELESFSPRTYVQAIHAAEEAGYAALLIDSLSHAWTGKDGALEQVDKAALKSKGNSYVGWRDVTPLHNEMIDSIVGAKLHVIATMRSKMEYVQEKDDRTGKTVIRKVGLQPVQREGVEYEFDLVCDIDVDHRLVVGKTRCRALDGQIIQKPDGTALKPFVDWLSGAERPGAFEEFLSRCQKAREVIGDDAYDRVIEGFDLGSAEEVDKDDTLTQGNLIQALRDEAGRQKAA